MPQTGAADGWQLDGSSPDAYERYLVPRLFRPWADRLIEVVGLAPGERVLDVGCGTGIVARRAAAHVGEAGAVVGLDLNETMLATARRVSADLHPPIEWRSGDMTDLPFADGSFDVVLCQQALQFVPDREAALLEMHRVLMTQGRVGLSVLCPVEHNPIYVPMVEALDRHVGAEAGAMMRSPFSDWTAADLRELLTGAGFRDVNIRLDVSTVRYPSTEDFVRYEAASSPLARPIGAMSDDSRAALLTELDTVLRPYIDDDGILSPMLMHIVTARR